DKAAVGGDVFVGFDALDLHWQFEFDFVAGLPIAGDEGVAFFDPRCEGFAVEGQRFQAADRRAWRVERARLAIRNAHEYRKFLRLLRVNRDDDFAAPGIIGL